MLLFLFELKNSNGISCIFCNRSSRLLNYQLVCFLCSRHAFIFAILFQMVIIAVQHLQQIRVCLGCYHVEISPQKPLCLVRRSSFDRPMLCVLQTPSYPKCRCPVSPAARHLPRPRHIPDRSLLPV